MTLVRVFLTTGRGGGLDIFFYYYSTLMTLHYTKVTYKRLLTKSYLQKVTYRKLLIKGYFQKVTYMSMLKSVT